MSSSTNFSDYSIAIEKADHIVYNDVDADVLRTTDALENRKRNSFMPAVNLPPEILTMIFEFACSSDDDDWAANAGLRIEQQRWFQEEYPVNATAVTPLFIGAICSAWRNIAWDASKLWSKITLLYSEDDDEKIARLLDYWLSKSGECLLTVKLIAHIFVDFVTTECIKAVDVIAEYAHRLHTLHLFLPSAWEPALIRIASCSPLLTRLSLSAFDNEGDTFVELGDLFANALHLREVTLSGYSTADLSLPWIQLESFKSDYYNALHEPLDTLRLCPHLRCFAFYLNNISWTVSPSVPVRHAALEALEMIGYNETMHSEFFKMLELPALRSFVLHLDMRPREWSSWLLPFLSGTARTLETLDLHHSCPWDEELLTVLRVVPRLRRLVLRNSSKYDKQKGLSQRVLDLMNPTKYEELECERVEQLDGQAGGDGDEALESGQRGNRHCLVPNLDTFKFEGNIAFSPHTLVEFLVGRWRGCSTPMHCSSGPGLDNLHKKHEEPGKISAPGNLLQSNLNAPPARLRSATFVFPKQIQFEDEDAAIVQGLRLEGMGLKFLAGS